MDAKGLCLSHEPYTCAIRELTTSFSNQELSYVFGSFSNLRSFGRMLYDAAIIGTSNMILLIRVVSTGSDFTQIWDIDFKRRRMRLCLANVNCLYEIMEKISGVGFLKEFTSAFMQGWKGSSRQVTFTLAYFIQKLQAFKIILQQAIFTFLEVNTTETLTLYL